MTIGNLVGGTGGGLRYLTEEPTEDMVNQESAYSCVVACVRQLLKDAGPDVGEAMLVAQIGVVDGFGSSAGIASVTLSARHPRLMYVGGCLDDGQLPTLFRRDPWIAFLRTDRGSVHSVIVDGCDDDLVTARDPWGLSGPGSQTGTRPTLSLADSLHHWAQAIFNGIAPTAIK